MRQRISGTWVSVRTSPGDPLERRLRTRLSPAVLHAVARVLHDRGFHSWSRQFDGENRLLTRLFVESRRRESNPRSQIGELFEPDDG